MKAVTKVNIREKKACCGAASKKIAQCCAKQSKLVAGCHD